MRHSSSDSSNKFEGIVVWFLLSHKRVTDIRPDIQSETRFYSFLLTNCSQTSRFTQRKLWICE